VTVTDAHIHIQPFHMMPAAVAATFWKGKPNRAELESYAAEPRKLLARMDEDDVARVGLINYVSPDLMGFTAEANPWMLKYFPRLEEIADKTVWGTDWPSPGVTSMRTNVEAFRALPVSDDTKRKVLHENAARIFR
jgi:predicted TIM-barrel fold metal-dependent hydrolase